MTERRTAPQTIRVAPEPEKLDYLTQFKADLRTFTVQQILAGVIGSDVTKAPPGHLEAVKAELDRRSAANHFDPEVHSTGQLGALSWEGLRQLLRLVKTPAKQNAVIAEMVRRKQSGNFGPRSP